MALAEIEANEAPSRAAMLKLNMREAREALKMRVAELESAPVEGVETALQEAKGLVTVVGEAFNFS
ncbi:MAG: hypothetical protein HC767_04410 [Akkermansiaceae bacterium]|nr:hypothetical protein [Akkermansiaceae bacterium]